MRRQNLPHTTFELGQRAALAVIAGLLASSCRDRACLPGTTCVDPPAYTEDFEAGTRALLGDGATDGGDATVVDGGDGSTPGAGDAGADGGTADVALEGAIDVGAGEDAVVDAGTAPDAATSSDGASDVD